jgi:hypothetical protein
MLYFERVARTKDTTQRLSPQLRVDRFSITQKSIEKRGNWNKGLEIG